MSELINVSVGSASVLTYRDATSAEVTAAFAPELTNPASVFSLIYRRMEELMEHQDLPERSPFFERCHATWRLASLSGSKSSGKVKVDSERRRFILQTVQPGLAGLMDGSVSTLAPVFAAAYATHHSREAFLVGMAASIGAGISMGFTEALSDDGVLSGRGRPWRRGLICGLMTALGGISHTLPFLIRPFAQAMAVAAVVVAAELVLIAWIRHRYMDTPLLSATFQVVTGGSLVFLVGILIGSI